MKWCSVENYRPPEGVYLFVLMNNNHIEVGHYSHGQFLFVDDIRMPILDVTHFCMPDPVEIEE